MTMPLIDQAERLSQFVKRNVIDMPLPKKLFATLIEEDADLISANEAMHDARAAVSGQSKLSAFYYDASIDYPFTTEPYMASRYSDGRYPVWYSAKSLETTFYETAYHAYKRLSAIGGLENESPIIQNRAIYNVFCDGIFINLIGKEDAYPGLVEDDYQFTQALGKEIRRGGYPGLLSPSVRNKGGVNVNVFKKSCLSQSTHEQSISYQIDLKQHVVIIPQFDNLQISFSDALNTENA